MIAVISPAKTLNFDHEVSEQYTLPRFPRESKELIEVLRTKSSEDVRSLMDVSEKIAELNVDRYQNFSFKHTVKNARPCGLVFRGDVYLGLEAEHFSKSDMEFAQEHLRILSGLYGLLRPLDLIQAYRLEMGTKLAFDDYTTLYNYWEDKIVKLLLRDLKAQGDDIIINLASQEYFRAIDRTSLKARVVDVEFKDFKGDDYKIISFYAKKARGMMSRYMIKNQISDIEALQGFDYGGYSYNHETSTEDKLVFLRG